MQALWMLLASLLFAFMGVCVKFASLEFTTSEIVMYRGLVGVVFLFVLSRTNKVSLKTAMPMRHFGRGMVGVISMWMWFYAIGKLPLAVANTLSYMAPIWLAGMLFGANWWRGKTNFAWNLPAAIVFSFIGVVLMLQPSVKIDQMPVVVVSIAGSVLAALAYLQVRAMGLLGEPETRVVFYFSVTSALAGAVSGYFEGGFHPLDLKSAGLLLLVGLFACTAQLAMTRAYRLGNPLVTANLSYSGIVFSALLGILVWHDHLSLVSWLGVTVIMISGIAATYLHTKASMAALAKVAN